MTCREYFVKMHQSLADEHFKIVTGLKDGSINSCSLMCNSCCLEGLDECTCFDGNIDAEINIKNVPEDCKYFL